MGANPGVRPIAPAAFEAIADIMDRWSVERDVWVSPSEVEQARLYLACVGVATLPLPDGHYAIDGERAGVCGAARLVLLGLRHLHRDPPDVVAGLVTMERPAPIRSVQ